MAMILIGCFLFLVSMVWLAVAVTRNTAGIGTLVLLILSLVLIIIGGRMLERKSPRPKPTHPVIIEYSASEYSLKYRIVEFEGQRDTTYVLVKKINEKDN